MSDPGNRCPVVKTSTCYWKDMWQKMNSMRLNWQLCDVTLLTDDNAVFKGHSPVLAASSDLFYSHFVQQSSIGNKDEQHPMIKIAGIKANALEVTLDFIYGVTPTTKAGFELLHSGAEKLGIPGAAKFCLKKLTEWDENEKLVDTPRKLQGCPFKNPELQRLLTTDFASSHGVVLNVPTYDSARNGLDLSSSEALKDLSKCSTNIQPQSPELPTDLSLTTAAQYNFPVQHTQQGQPSHFYPAPAADISHSLHPTDPDLPLLLSHSGCIVSQARDKTSGCTVSRRYSYEERSRSPPSSYSSTPTSSYESAPIASRHNPLFSKDNSSTDTPGSESWHHCRRSESNNTVSVATTQQSLSKHQQALYDKTLSFISEVLARHLGQKNTCTERPESGSCRGNPEVSLSTGDGCRLDNRMVTMYEVSLPLPEKGAVPMKQLWPETQQRTTSLLPYKSGAPSDNDNASKQVDHSTSVSTTNVPQSQRSDDQSLPQWHSPYVYSKPSADTHTTVSTGNSLIEDILLNSAPKSGPSKLHDLLTSPGPVIIAVNSDKIKSSEASKSTNSARQGQDNVQDMRAIRISNQVTTSTSSLVSTSAGASSLPSKYIVSSQPVVVPVSARTTQGSMTSEAYSNTACTNQASNSSSDSDKEYELSKDIAGDLTSGEMPMDIHHALIPEMTLNDLTRLPECPHLKKLAANSGLVMLDNDDSPPATTSSQVSMRNGMSSPVYSSTTGVATTKSNKTPTKSSTKSAMADKRPDVKSDDNFYLDFFDNQGGSSMSPWSMSSPPANTVADSVQASIHDPKEVPPKKRKLALISSETEIVKSLTTVEPLPILCNAPQAMLSKKGPDSFSQGSNSTKAISSSPRKISQVKSSQPVNLKKSDAPPQKSKKPQLSKQKSPKHDKSANKDLMNGSAIVLESEYIPLDSEDSNAGSNATLGQKRKRQISATESQTTSDSQQESAVTTKSSSIKSFPCNDCGAILHSFAKLQTHSLRQHGKGRLYACSDCEFKSPRKKDVQAHMLSRHRKAPPGLRVFRCDKCDYLCMDKHRHEEHIASHSREPRYQCTQCNRCYTTRRGLYTHQQYHNQDRPHVCNLCDASFKVRDKLRDHMRLIHTHPGQKPYKCAYCKHASALRGNCNQHIRKTHPDKPILVIDLLADQRMLSKNYGYASMEGEGIHKCLDVKGSAKVGALQSDAARKAMDVRVMAK